MDIVGDPVTVVQQVGAWVASAFFSATDRVLYTGPAAPIRIHVLNGGTA